MLKSKLFIIFWAVAFVCLTPSFTLAAEGDTAWPVENFGVFQTPAKWQTVKFEEVLDRLEIFFKKIPDMKPKTSASPETNASPTANTNKVLTDFTDAKNFLDKMFKEHNINIYQVTLDNNDTYYIAGLLLFKEDKPMSAEEAAYFDEKAPKKTRQEFAAMLTMLQNEAIKSMQIMPGLNPTFDMDVKMLPAGQVEQLTAKNTPAYGIGTRVIVNAFGLTGPYYVKTYVFNLDGRRSYAVLWCLDSERAFWDKTFKPIVSSIK